MARRLPNRNAAHFIVRAESRLPKLGRDYNATTHKYTESYLHPQGYGITVDAFPGKILVSPREDQQLPPGGDPKDLEDIWQLLCPPGTIGWEFAIEGHVDANVGMPRWPFKSSGSRGLPATTGVFHEDRDDNAWNWRFIVPACGTYTITVSTLDKGGGKTLVGTKRMVLRDILVVAIGDSLSAGQGNPDVAGIPEGFDPDIGFWDVVVFPVAVYKMSKEAMDWCWNQIKAKFNKFDQYFGLKLDMDPKPVWLEPRAYRSLRSGAAHAARMLEDLDNGLMVTFLPFGRTDSSIDNGLIGGRLKIDGWIGDRGQVSEVAATVGKRRIDALLINIGVNDIGVTSNLKGLMLGDSEYIMALGDGDSTDAKAREDIKAEAKKSVDNLPIRLNVLEDSLRVLNVHRTYLIEYPTGVFCDINGQPANACGIFTSNFDMDITKADARAIQEIVSWINTALKNSAAARGQKGWVYVGGVDAAFKGHGYCVGEQTYYVQAEESMGLQGDLEGTIHPNPKGALAIGKRVYESVQKNTVDPILRGPVVG